MMTTQRTTKTKAEWKAEIRRLEKAGEAADEILRVAVPKTVAPVNPFAIAERERRLRVVSDHFGNAFDGQLEFHRRRNRFIAFCNTKYDAQPHAGEHHPRTRFAMAHELGHFYLDRHRAYLEAGGKAHQSRGEFVADQMAEREADAFAASMLLPTDLLKPVLNQQEPSLDFWQEIAGEFQVSRLSTMIRCVQLSHYPCAVVGIRGGAVAWRMHSQPLIEGGCYPLPKGAPLSAASAEAWRSFAAGSPVVTRGASTIGKWFEVYDRDDLRKMHVEEEFLAIPRMETLTVLLSVSEADLESSEDDGSEEGASSWSRSR